MTGAVDPTREAMAAFRDLPGDRPIAMINLIRFRETAAYPDDHPDHARARTGAQAYAAYGRAAAPPFARAGGRQVWLGRPELTLIGPADEAWDLAFIAEYPGGEAFESMLRDPEYKAAVIHRQAAVADSRLIRCEPSAAGAGFGEGRPA
ncbi:MAG: DUF1330 domain-containing protein [Alphaproteobacteria bacterium]|uniref:DUF1330 domain-containing protein n=1 Tax=Brevundimonas sp. TaxID=1871086 RepID=UPI0017C9C963|nr:DUF1330 domain-containing protein [Brevundimonas sp.]MBA3050640.1 DUF1330 domain-containing protein [Brevundimonas sp.]MBU3971458.1 DUF1330 domain-containing protein [Alphaproteobacteria bacterium]MBU3973924.1 DUF1330 domain-containing protein [Alphaproteobacteria bacterium]